MKKKIWAVPFLLFAVALITYRIISYDKPENTLLIKEKTIALFEHLINKT